MIVKIISGGQTGVDRAALDAAIELNIAYAGWCPKGRIDEFGTIPEKYNQLQEISGNFKDEKANYETRTRLNIKGSDATLILVPEIHSSLIIKDGTLLTMQEVQKQNKLYLIVDLSELLPKNVACITHWIDKNHIEILNIAGPRESTCPGIYQLSLELLKIVFIPY